ncbi:MAG: helix-turn-helix transcriptional regulator [Nitrospinae bacterium]|nr:helix-turn-helix transcriptional regulator [Nitrospinota bacterium]
MKETASLFRLLGVEARIGIIELLKEGRKAVSTLAEVLGISQSAISQHLRILKAAGLVRDERQGQWVYYRLNEERLEACREQANEVCSCGCRCDEPRLGQAGLPEGREALETYRRKLEEELRRVEERLKALEGG